MKQSEWRSVFGSNPKDRVKGYWGVFTLHSSWSFMCNGDEVNVPKCGTWLSDSLQQVWCQVAVEQQLRDSSSWGAVKRLQDIEVKWATKESRSRLLQMERGPVNMDVVRVCK